MAQKELALYLNDHLAGSVAALELLDHLIKQGKDKRLETFFRVLRDDVQKDQNVLRGLIDRLGAKESSVRKAGAWIMEKFGRAKVGIGGVKAEGAGLLQALEVLVLGITGKQLLWRSLAAAAESSPNLKGTEYERLEERAIEQIERVEAERLRAARETLAKKAK